nr:unnamed protein product [Digitaria exilis]
MTKAATLYGAKTQTEVLRPGPLRPANIIRSKFPTYKNGSNGIVIKLADGPEIPPLKEIVAKETADLLDRRQRLSVRELAMKFEKGLNAATLLSNEVEILAVQLSKREAELLQQKEEVTKLAKSLKQASEDAKRIVEEERANSHTEIECAKNAVQRVQQAVQEHEKMSQSTGKQLELHKRLKENGTPSFDLEGLQCLGSVLRIVALSGTHMDLSSVSIQWFRIHPKESDKEIISGGILLCATRPVYALEPQDVGRYLQAEIDVGGEIAVAKTAGPVDPDAGLVDYVETLVRKPETEFNLCGVRGGGEAASQAMFWQPRNDLSLVLAFETARERNTAIMLARRFAIDCNVCTLS